MPAVAHPPPAAQGEEPWSDEESPKNPTRISTSAAAKPATPPPSAGKVTAPMPVAFDTAAIATAAAGGAGRKFAAPSPVVSKGCSKSDFEAILASGSDPSDEIRRSAGYAEWYYSQNPRDPRALAPIADHRTPPRHGTSGSEDRFSPSADGKPPQGRRQGSQGKTGHNNGLSLEAGNFNHQQSGPYAARGGVNFNPYAAQVNAYSLPSPGTQFYAQFAPSPMVGGAAVDPSHYAGVSPSTAAYLAAQQSAASNAATAGSHSGTSPVTQPPPEDAAAIAAAQQAFYQQQQQHAAMMQYGQQSPYGYGGYPMGSYPPQSGLMGQPYPGYGAPHAGAPVQLTPYPSSNHAAPQGAPGGSFYPQEMMGYPGQYPHSGYYGHPSVNVGGVIMPHAQDSYGGMSAEGMSGRGRGRGGRGADRGGDRGGMRGGRGGRGGSVAGVTPYVPRSELLERFRNSMGSEEWKLEDIDGHAMEFARDQDGSRFIQRMLDDSPPAVVDRLFREIFSNPVELITDVFGNYVLQKLLEVGTHDQLLLVAESLRSQVVPLTLQTYGCRVIQKCIEVMPPRGLDIIIGELQGNVAKCIQDQNGNHVVQKCVEVVPDRCGFIVSAFTGRVKELATHAYGCRVIQCILQHCPAHEQEIFTELLQDIVALTEDQYGNYVVQHVLQHASHAQGQAVYEKLKDHFYRFSVHKFASNVMERLFARCSDAQRSYIIDSLVRELDMGAQQKEECVDGKSRNPTQLFFMMKDQYANYVVQKVIDLCSDEHKRRLTSSTQPYVNALRKFTFGKHMVARLERMKLLPSGSSTGGAANADESSKN